MKFKHIMMTLLFSLTVSGCQNVNGILEFSLNDDNNSYSVTCRFDVDPISIEIPSTHLEKPVTSIADYAFSDCQSLTSIMIPDGVTSIGDYALSNCPSLTSIVIPNSVTSIGKSAFSYCTSLTSIVIPESVTSIGDFAFIGCPFLTSIVIPSSVTSIGKGAFFDCQSLTSINVNNDNSNYSSVDGVLFNKNKTTLIKYPCGKLENVFVIPDSVTSIDGYAFRGCSFITSIVIPEGVTSIGEAAFRGCSSITSIVVPISVTLIGDWTFSLCSSLTIFAEASSKPSGWSDRWNSSNRPVVWGHTS